MKKITKLMVLLLTVASIAMFASCSKDNEDLIVGKWKLTQDSSDGVNWHTAEWSNLVYNFNTDGTVEAFGISVPYTIDGTTLVINGKTNTIITLTSSELIIREEYKEHTYRKLIKL